MLLHRSRMVYCSVGQSQGHQKLTAGVNTEDWQGHSSIGPLSWLGQALKSQVHSLVQDIVLQVWTYKVWPGSWFHRSRVPSTESQVQLVPSQDQQTSRKDQRVPNQFKLISPKKKKTQHVHCQHQDVQSQNQKSKVLVSRPKGSYIKSKSWQTCEN